MGGLRQSYSEPTLPNRSLLQGGHAVLHRHADFETQRKVLQHYRRLDGVKPSVHREQQERDFQKHRRLLQIRQRFPLKPLPGQQDSRQNPSRRGFERKLEQMLLQDFDGAEKEFAWQQHVTTRVLPEMEAASASPCTDRTSGSPAAEKPADSREAHLEPSSAAAGSSPAPVSSPDAGSTGAAAHLEVPSSAQIEDGSGGSDIASGHIAQGGAVGGDHISSAGSPDLSHPGVDEPGLADVGGGGAGGGRRMRPPDFRSILQGDHGPAGAASANMAMPSVTPAVGTVMGGSDLANGSPFAVGQVQPANADMGSANAQNIPAPDSGLAPKTSNPIFDTATSPEPAPAANFGGGGLGGGRRMRPPDFRSILQGDDGPAGGVSANMGIPSVTPAVGTVMGGSDLANGSPFAGGQVQPANAAMGSANAQNIPAPDSGLAPKTSNPIFDTATSPEPAPVANFGGGGLGGGRRMRPPDFRSILQGDDGPAGGASANVAMPSVTPAVGTVMGGSDLANGSPFAPTSAAMGSRPGVPLGTAGVDSNLNRPGPTSGLDSAGQMRPPDFRSLFQGDDLPAGSGLAQGLPASNAAFGNGSLPDSPGVGRASPADIPTAAMPGLQASHLPGDPKPAESKDPFGLEELSGGYVPSAASAPRRRRPRAGQL